MSVKNPEWYELPDERWQEMSTVYENSRSYRDSQRQKEYDAESEFQWNYFHWLEQQGKRPGWKHFETTQEAQVYISDIWNSEWAKKRWRKIKNRPHPIVFFVDNDHSSAYVQYGNIHLPQWARNQFIILHELAHTLKPFDCGVGHGRFFARTLLELVEREIGIEARRMLKAAFSKRGVKSNPRPQYSKETLEKMQRHGRKMAQVLQQCRTRG